MKIAIIGASGKVGSLVLSGLAGHDVRALVRTESSMRAVRERANVETVHADLDDHATLAPAMADAEVLFLATPFDPQQTARELAAVEAAEQVGVRRVVKLSSYAAGVRPIAPSAQAHVAVEGRLRRSAMSWTSLRPDWFMDNLLTQVDHLRAGEFFFPAGDATVSAVDVRDVADVAVAEILADVPTGGAVMLTGPDDLGFAELAERLGRSCGTALTWRDGPAPGWPDFYAAGMDKLFAGYRARGFAPRTHAVSEILDRPARTVEDFGSQVVLPALSGPYRS